MVDATAQAQAPDPAVAQAEAERLQASAREHKRQVGAHRKGAQEDMKRLERLIRQCTEYGITLVLEGPMSQYTKPTIRRHSGNQGTPRS